MLNFNLKEYFRTYNSDNIQLISNNNIDIIQQPPNITLPLKTYQKRTIYEMLLREQRQGFFVNKYNFYASNFCILGEVVGSGKTFNILSLISYKKTNNFYNPNNPSAFMRFQVIKKNLGNKVLNERFIKRVLDYIPTECPYFNIETEFFLNKPSDLRLLSIKTPKNIINIPCNVIVVPHNLTRQWENDIQTHTNLKYFLIRNVRNLRQLNVKNIKNFLKNIDIILCNATKYNEFVNLTKNCRWERVIFDEADSIHIPRSNYIYSKYYWFITATYDSIVSQKNTGFLRRFFIHYRRRLIAKNIFNFNKFIIKTDPELVKQETQLLKPMNFYHMSKKPLWIEIIEDTINNVGNIDMREQMYAELNISLKMYLGRLSIIETSEIIEKDIVLILLAWLKRKVNSNNQRIRDCKNRILNLRTRNYSETKYNQERIRYMKLITKYTNKRNTINKYRFLIKNTVDKLNICLCCLQNLRIPYYKYNCKETEYNVCVNCNNKLDNFIEYYDWGRDCIFCQDLYDVNHKKTIMREIVKVVEEKEEGEKYNTKIEHIHNLLKDQNKKFLVFSNYTNLFDKYLNDFKKNNIKYGLLKGNNNVINKRLRDFKSGDLKVLLLNGKHYGSGLNLQDATDIIITHRIDKDIETQIIGRANRMGRVGTLNVHYIIFENEIKINN